MKSTVSFRVSKECYSHEEVVILGSIPELGCWKAESCLVLEKMDYDKWEGSITIENQKMEFKVAVIDQNRNITEWETLDNNMNRKYKVVSSVVLKIQWGNLQGKSLPLVTNKGVKGVLSIVINQPPTRTKVNQKDIFNPFKKAEHSDSQEELKEGLHNKRRQSFCTLNKKQFLELFYQPSRHQTNPYKIKATVQKRLLILCKYHPKTQKFYWETFENVVKLCSHLIWVYSVPSEEKLQLQEDWEAKVQMVELNSNISSKIPDDVLRLFELKSDQMLEDRALCIALNIEFAQMKLNKSLNGLMLGGSELTQEKIQAHLVSKTSQYFTYVAFENPKFNQYYLSATIDKLKSSSKKEGEKIKQLQEQIQFFQSTHDLQNPSTKLYQTMVKDAEQTYATKETDLQKLDVDELYKSIEKSEHCLYIFDYDMLVSGGRKPSSLFSKVLQLEQKTTSLIIVVCGKSKQECIQTLPEIEKTRIIVISEQGLWVRLTHEWVNTNKRHQDNIEKLKRWLKIYTEKYEGSIEETHNHLSYTNSSPEVIKKLFSEFQSILAEQKYIKVQATQNQIMMKWYINRNRCIDSIVQFRCMCEGSLDLIFLLINNEQKSYIAYEIERLIRSHPLLFNKSLSKYFVIEGQSYFNIVTNYIERQDIQRLKFIE